MYEIKDFSFGYQIEKPIFSKVDIILKFEKITLLTGANGSGKTTFCRILSGLEKKYNGYILLENKELAKFKNIDIASKIVYLKQEPLANLVAATAEEDLLIWQNKFRKIGNIKYQKNRSIALKQFELHNISQKPVWELSNGQIKRIGLAALLLNNNKYWILDEPTSALDENLISKLIRILALRKKEGNGALIITHRLKEFEYITDSILKIENRKIIDINK